MNPQDLEEKFKVAETGAATEAKGWLVWLQAHPSAAYVLAGLLVGLVLGFMLFRR